ELVLICHRTHPLAHRHEVPLASSRNERFILLEERSGITSLFRTHCTAAGFYPNSPAHLSRHRLILKAVSRKMGISVLPRHLVETYYDEDIAIVTFAKPIPTTIGFAWLRNAEDNPLLDDFILSMQRMLRGE
ncbi:MAG: LysR family transcriptional regulator substrate-binding protein, partial [Atopobiaceae bacterium]|nr:LysR family transcriptional regulator substrate-binding protein [Atopobiaceae bacterium]